MSSGSGWEKRLTGIQKVENNHVAEKSCLPMKKKGKMKLSVASGWLSVPLNPFSPTSTVRGLAGCTVSSYSLHLSASLRARCAHITQSRHWGCAQRRGAQLLGHLQIKDKLLATHKRSFRFSADYHVEVTVTQM